MALSAGSLALSAHDLKEQAIAAHGVLSKQAAAERAAAHALEAIQPMSSTSGVAAEPISVALAGEIEAIGRYARERSVEIERIATPGNQQGYTAASAMTQVIPMTNGKLIAVRLNVNGTYSDYTEFKSFLGRLARRGAIQSLQLRSTRFELTTDIYGVPEGA